MKKQNTDDLYYNKFHTHWFVYRSWPDLIWHRDIVYLGRCSSENVRRLQRRHQWCKIGWQYDGWGNTLDTHVTSLSTRMCGRHVPYNILKWNEHCFRFFAKTTQKLLFHFTYYPADGGRDNWVTRTILEMAINAYVHMLVAKSWMIKYIVWWSEIWPFVSSSLQITNRSFRYASPHLCCGISSLLHFVNLILFTVLLVHLITYHCLYISLQT